MVYLTLPLSLAIIDWIALARCWKIIDIVTKPGTMLALLVWTWIIPEPGFNTADLLFIRLGIAFALIGDLLLLPQIDQFLGGLAAFLLGHLAYIVVFDPLPLPTSGNATLLLLIIFGTAGYATLQLQQRLRAGNNARYSMPVLLYSLVITIMLASAWTTTLRPAWPGTAAWLVACGATLFTVSDILLAWNRFVRPLAKSRLKVRVLYHLGQIAIVLGAAIS